MRIRIFICWLSILACASSGVGKTVSRSKPISVPNFVRKRMPRGAKSCLFAYFHPTPKSPEMAIHLYNNHVAKELTPQRTNGAYHFTVGLFEVGRSGKQKRKNYRFIRTFPLEYQGDIWPPTNFGFQFLWLDPKQEKIPVFMFSLFGIGECFGAAGDKILTVFPKGWNGKALFQNFTFDEGAGCGAVTVVSAEIDSIIDDKGFVQFSTSESKPWIGWTQIIHLRWNGEKFAPIPGTEPEIKQNPNE